MKKLFLCALLSALSLPVVAQTGDKVESVTITDTNLRITVPAKRYRMLPEEFYNFKGAYDLSNGMTLTLSSRGFGMYAKLSNQDWHKIVAIAPNAFVALDEQLKIRIDLHDNGDVSGEVLMVVPMLEKVGGISGKDQLELIAFR
jgi:hypothetical protein